MSWDDFDDDLEDFDDIGDLDYEPGVVEDKEPEEDEEELLGRIEQAFRKERARVRGCDDLGELRALRADYEGLASGGRLNQAGRIRAHDLVELVDDRITDLKAQRVAGRSG